MGGCESRAWIPAVLTNPDANPRNLRPHDCNTGIGKFKDNIDLLKSVIRYLQQHKHIK